MLYASKTHTPININEIGAKKLKREYKRLNWNFSYEDMASIIYQSRGDYQKKLKGYDYIIKKALKRYLFCDIIH